MEIKALEFRLDKRISETRKRYLKTNLLFMKSDLNDADWTARELKRAEWLYRATFAFCVLVIGSIILLSVFNDSGNIPGQKGNNTAFFMLGVFALLSMLGRTKMTVEMLRNAMFLVEIKREIGHVDPNLR